MCMAVLCCTSWQNMINIMELSLKKSVGYEEEFLVVTSNRTSIKL